MISIALCEDNEIQRSIMQEFLNEYVKTKAISFQSFSCGEDLLDYVKVHGSFDIYILDVIMPGVSGMEVATTLRLMKDDNIIIFTTSALEYGPMSYDVDAFYYQVKPVDSQKFFRVLDKACAKLNPEDEFMEIRTKGGSVRLKAKNIMYVSLEDRAPVFVMNDEKVYEGLKLRGTFREIVTPLLSNPDFVLCGVGLVVNLKYVSALDSESLLLANGKQLYFPKSAYPDLKKIWKNNLK